MRTKPRFVGRLLLGLAALAVGCAGAASPTALPTSPASPTAPPAMPTPSPLEEIRAALRAWDFAGARRRLEAAGRPALPVDLLNEALRQGARAGAEVLRAWVAERWKQHDDDWIGVEIPEERQAALRERGRRLAEQSLAFLREACDCVDGAFNPIPERFPAGLDEGAFLVWRLAMQDMPGGPAEDSKLVQAWFARRLGRPKDEWEWMERTWCPMAGRPGILFFGFDVYDVEAGRPLGRVPGWEQLEEWERRAPFGVNCLLDRVILAYMFIGGLGVKLEVEWTGETFRFVRLTREQYPWPLELPEEEEPPKYPEDYRYTREHMWIHLQGDIGTVGITYYLLKRLGDIISVELPAVGQAFRQMQAFGRVGGVKAEADLYMPMSGEVVEVNLEVINRFFPEAINTSPHERGWLVRIRIHDPAEWAGLMTARDYEAYVEQSP